MAHYGKYDEAVKLPLAVFDDACLAEEALSKYISNIELLKSAPEPNQGVNYALWTVKQETEWYKWDTEASKARYFNFCEIEEFNINEIKII